MSSNQSKAMQTNPLAEQLFYEQFLKELQTFANQMNQIEEKALKMKIETGLMAVELSTRIETMDTIRQLVESIQTVANVESEAESKPNSQSIQIESKPNDNSNGIEVIDISEDIDTEEKYV